MIKTEIPNVILDINKKCTEQASSQVNEQRTFLEDKIIKYIDSLCKTGESPKVCRASFITGKEQRTFLEDKMIKY